MILLYPLFLSLLLGFWVGVTCIQASAVSLPKPAARFLSEDETEAIREKDFLQLLYSSLNLEEIPEINWFPQDGPSPSVCQFYGVFCNRQGRVQIMDLSSLGIQGTLPDDFSNLKYLKRLLLRKNQISGSLPTKLPFSLIHLNLDGNKLEGYIPKFTFVTEDGESETSGLQRLILSGNTLSGPISPEICALQKLRDLNLARNQNLSGSLPACLANLSDLKGLQVHQNDLVGPVADDLCQRQGALNQPLPLEDDGWCARFQFCKDGFRKVTSNGPVSCERCEQDSNVIGSLTCRWIASNDTLPPTNLPSSVPSMSPMAFAPVAVTPSGIPSVNVNWNRTNPPSPSPSTAVTVSPTRSPTVAPTIDDAPSNDQAPTLPEDTNHPTRVPTALTMKPTMAPTDKPSVFGGNGAKVDQIQDQSKPRNRRTGRTRFFNFFLPALILLCFVGVAFLLFLLPNHGRRQRLRFLTLSSFGDASSDEDFEDIVTLQAPHSPHVHQEEGNNLHDCSKALPYQPCIVQPQTIGAKPRVRFLLDETTTPLEIPDLPHAEESMEPSIFGEVNRNPVAPACELDALYEQGLQVDSSPAAFAQERTRALASEWLGLSSPEAHLSPNSSVSERSASADSSSVSSTTPGLNRLYDWEEILPASLRSERSRRRRTKRSKEVSTSPTQPNSNSNPWMPFCGMTCGEPFGNQTTAHWNDSDQESLQQAVLGIRPQQMEEYSDDDYEAEVLAPLGNGRSFT